jgi:8-oxo-dGTP pyrophosphatase MutT (NUDIX family)
VLDVGESPIDCAVREIHEEMGVFVSVGGEGGKPALHEHGSVLFQDERSRCVLYVFSCTVNLAVDELKLQESEVESVELMTADQVLGLPEGQVTGDGLMCLRKYLEDTKNAPQIAGSL